MESAAWAAGLFEGKGSVTASRGRPRLQLKTSEEESVRRFETALGVGKTFGPYGGYASSIGTRPYFLWVAEYEDGQAAADAMRPFLSGWRRQRLDEVFPA